MISILVKSVTGTNSNKYCILVGGELSSTHRDFDSLVRRIYEEHVECDRVYESSDYQRKKGYQELTVDERANVERLVLNFQRREGGSIGGEVFSDNY